MELYERVSGARMHANYIRPGGVSQDLPLETCEAISNFVEQFPDRLLELNSLLSRNRVWLQRLNEVGPVNRIDALN